MSQPPFSPTPFSQANPAFWGAQGRTLRWMLLTPLLAVIALALLMGATIWYLTRAEETQREQALMRDVDSAEIAVRQKLQSNQEALVAMATTFAGQPQASTLRHLSQNFLVKSPEVLFLAWVDRSHIIRVVHTSQAMPSESFGRINSALGRPASRLAFDYALSSKRANYSGPIRGIENDVFIDLHVPVLKDGSSLGTLVASYSLPSLLLNVVPNDINARVAFGIFDSQGQALARTRSLNLVLGKPSQETPLEPIGKGLMLRGYSYLPATNFYNDIMTTLIAGLISLAVISQFLIWRNTRRRLGAESELAEETAFRRAMENSMSTGMRVIDPQGRISYVNPAFCRMVGFSFDELVNQTAPYPYWPPEATEPHAENLRRMLRGESPPSGLPIHIMRKDGTRLIVRMYTSPLIDHTGQQAGWMTSVTDITEQTRIRQELALAQERFITVLQALDVAVSVATPSPQDELLFANEAYKKWFGSSLTQGHRYFVDIPRGPWSDVRETFNSHVKRWFEVRIRHIKWVDGRDVELVVAADITQERATEEAQRIQRDKLQQTSRLVTMGEMASSLAHELNQPLTAIANYTSGAAARLKLSAARHEPPPIDELIELLTKTARQAERAGQVIRRIRGFVKRSDPIRKPVEAHTIVADALGLAEIDARAEGLVILEDIEDSLPVLHVDPILIEQVLLNLIKNGLEAMKGSDQRTLQVSVRMTDAQQVQFSVIDQGPGVPPEIGERLFDSFYTTKADGMGMGLNICRSIIESHQGRLWFENMPNGGCCFRFTLPLLTPIASPDAQPAA